MDWNILSFEGVQQDSFSVINLIEVMKANFKPLKFYFLLETFANVLVHKTVEVKFGELKILLWHTIALITCTLKLIPLQRSKRRVD